MTELILGSGNDNVIVKTGTKASTNGGATWITLLNGTLDGGAGVDKLTLDDFWNGSANFSLSTTGDGIITLTTSSGTLAIKNFESLSFQNFTINLGNAGANKITGSKYNDPVLYGLGGNDTIDGGTGNDKMYGGDGNDTYYVDSASDIVDELATARSGVDTIISTISLSLIDTDGAGANGGNVENLTLAGTALTATGNALNNVLTGNASNNTLTGNAGNDTLSGGAGADTMVGGLGNDTYVVDSLADVVTEAAGQGTDTIRSSITYSLMSAANVERLMLTGTAAIDGTGTAANNTIIGNAAANHITGGGGKDTLTGAGGADIFVYKTIKDSGVGVKADVITDFAHGVDKIDLKLVDASTAAGKQAFHFVGSGALAAAGDLHAIVSGTDMLLEADTDGNGTVDFQILLKGVSTFDINDLLI